MAVPWNQIVRWAPHLITLSRELLQRSQRVAAEVPATPALHPGELAQRIAALEENERRQAELVERMAEQQAELARAVVELHRRERLLVIALVAVAGLAVWALLR